MTTKAKFVSRGVKMQGTNWTRRMELRGGSAGTGEVLFAVEYWPESEPSCLQMERACAQFIANHPEIEVISSDDWIVD